MVSRMNTSHTSRGFVSLGLILLLVIGLAAFGGAGWYVSRQEMGAALVASPPSGPAPLAVIFSIQATDSTTESGVYYTIIFGDEEAGGFPRSANPTLLHTYGAYGTYVATVTRRTQCSSWECLGPSSELGRVTITVK